MSLGRDINSSKTSIVQRMRCQTSKDRYFNFVNFHLKNNVNIEALTVRTALNYIEQNTTLNTIFKV